MGATVTYGAQKRFASATAALPFCQESPQVLTLPSSATTTGGGFASGAGVYRVAGCRHDQASSASTLPATGVAYACVHSPDGASGALRGALLGRLPTDGADGSAAVTVELLPPTEVAKAVATRVDEAFASRRRITSVPSPGHDTAFRAVHGAADDLPGCFVDVFGTLALVTATTSGARESLLSPLLAALEDRGLSAFDVSAAATPATSSDEGSAGSRPAPPKLAEFVDTEVNYATPVRHDLTARGARRVVSSLLRTVVAPSPPPRVLCVSHGGNGAFALTALAAAPDASVDVIETCPVAHRIVATNAGAAAAAATSSVEAEAAKRLTVFGAKGAQVDLAALVGPSSSAAATRGSGSGAPRATGLDPLTVRPAVGTARRYALATVEVTGGRDAESMFAEVNTAAAAAARVKSGGHLLVWFRASTAPGGVTGAHASPAAFLQRLSPKLARSAQGVQRQARLVADLRLPSDYPLRLPGPGVDVAEAGDKFEVSASGAVEWLLPKRLSVDDVAAAAPVGWLLYVE